MRTTTSTALLAIALIAPTWVANAVPLELSHQGRIAERGVNFDGTGHFKFLIHEGGRDLNKQATASTTVFKGAIQSVVVTAPGAGYLTPPAVSFTARDGKGATATASISSGRVVAIKVTSGGSGYLSPPTVSIAPPTAPPVFESLWSHDGSSSGGEEPDTGVSIPVTKGLYAVRLGDLGVSGMTAPITAALLAGHDRAALRIWFSNTGKPGTFQLLTPDQVIGSIAFAIRAAVAEAVDDGAIGAAQIATGAITGDKIATGTISNSHIAAPGSEKVLISDGSGGSIWMTVDEFLLSKGYTPSLPGIVENLVLMEIDGIMSDTVQIINGPGMQIEDLGGNPSESGLNTEFAIVFDYDGSENANLQAWFDTPSSRALTIIVKDTTGTESFRWNAFEFQLTNIGTGTGNGGKNRYTLTHALVPDQILAIDRSPASLPNNVDRKPGDTKVEIEGVNTGGWPVVVDDPSAKTLTMTFDYNEGGGIWSWGEDIAEGGTFGHGRKSISLIYLDNSDNEIGRNNFFECFPIQYQYFTGFDINTKGRERIVISYDVSENASGGSLFVPPVIEYHPGTPLMEMPYDLASNGLSWEIDGVQTNQTTLPGEVPVLLSGPGWEIERIPGFGPAGKPDDQSGNNKEFPIILEVGGTDLGLLSDWREQYFERLPLNASPKSITIILRDGTATETFRWNLFEMIPHEITPLPSGRGRVTLYHALAPNNFIGYDRDPTSGWGDALKNNPAADTGIEIEGVTTVFAETTVDTARRTITLTFDFGEGGSIFDWAKAVAVGGASTIGKKSIHAADGGAGTNYFGCFPIAIQHFTGFEQDVKGKAKVVISYDFSEPAN